MCPGFTGTWQQMLSQWDTAVRQECFIEALKYRDTCSSGNKGPHSERLLQAACVLRVSVCARVTTVCTSVCLLRFRYKKKLPHENRYMPLKLANASKQKPTHFTKFWLYKLVTRSVLLAHDIKTVFRSDGHHYQPIMSLVHYCQFFFV